MRNENTGIFSGLNLFLESLRFYDWLFLGLIIGFNSAIWLIPLHFILTYMFWAISERNKMLREEYCLNVLRDYDSNMDEIEEAISILDKHGEFISYKNLGILTLLRERRGRMMKKTVVSR